MRRRLALGAIAALSSVTLLAGCGSSSSGGGTNNSSAPPKTEFTDALTSLSSGNVLTTTLALDTTAAKIKALAGYGKNPTILTDTEANLLATAKLTIETVAPKGKTLAQASTTGLSSGSDLSITGSAGGKTYFAAVVINKTLYLQIDLKGILDAAGQSGQYQTITSQAASFPAFVQDFLGGKYVSIPFAALGDLTSVIKAGIGGGSSAVPSTTQLQTLSTKLRAALLNDLTVTRTSTGSTDQLAISADVQTVVKDFLSTLAQGIPSLSGQIDPSVSGQVPSKVVKFGASVTGGSLSQLTFDVTQFAPAAKSAKQQQEFNDIPPVDLNFAESGAPITAPAGVTAVTFQDLVQFFTTVGRGA